MKCRRCNIDMRVDAAGVEIINDDIPDRVTEVYSVQTLTCRNPDCSNYNKVVETIKTRLN